MPPEPVVPAPPTTPAAPVGIEATIAAARERIAEGKPLIPEAPAPAEGAPAPAEGAPAPVVDEKGRVHDPSTGQFVEKPKDGEPAAAPGEAEAAPPAEPVVIELPGRRPTDTPHAITVDPTDTATIERLNQLVNAAGLGAKARDTLQAAREERVKASELIETIEYDPLAVLREKLSPEMQRGVALALLFSDDHFEAVRADLATALDNDAARRELRVSLKEQNDDARAALKQRTEGRRAALEAANVAVNAVTAMTPDDFTEENAEAFLRDAVRDLEDHFYATGKKPAAADIPGILAHRLRVYGIDATQAAAHLANGSGSGVRPQGAPARATVRSAAVAPTPPVSPKPKTAAELTAADRARRAAAAVPSPGAAVPPAGTVMPKGMTIQQAADFARKHGLMAVVGARK